MLSFKPGSLFSIVLVTKLNSSLAYVELYVTLGTIFFRFPDLAPNDITDKDLVMHDLFGSTMEENATLLHCHKST